MSDKKKKKGDARRPKPGSFPLARQAAAFLKDRHPILKFLLGFAGCMVLFYLFYYSSIYRNYLEPPFLNAQAAGGNAILHLLGHDTKAVGSAIASTFFSVDVKNGCDGLEALAILLSGILIFPASFRLKVPGLLWGTAVLMVLNLLRIAGLYLVGIHFSAEVFEIVHVQGGFILFTMVSVLLLFAWMNWAMKQNRPA